MRAASSTVGRGPAASSRAPHPGAKTTLAAANNASFLRIDIYAFSNAARAIWRPLVSYGEMM